ncbi:unnamed protein product [Rotaria sp. Silwood1]|nr:unnamed protein product [Rotaria sp. Silwood1]
MEANLEQLVVALNISSLSTDILQQITLLLQSKTEEVLPSFISQEYQSLFTLEHKVWQLLGEDSREWFNDSNYSEFFQTLGSFNKNMIFNQDNIKDEIIISLLMPDTIDQINSIFKQIEQSIDDNDPVITFASLWFDNLSFSIHEYPQLGHSPIIIQMNQYVTGHCILSEQFKFYLGQLRQSPLLQSLFTAKQLFYMRTCPFSLHVYFHSNPSSFDYTPDQILQNIGNDYLQIIQIQSYTIELWSTELLSCMTQLIGFMRAFLWWNGEMGTKFKILLSTEKILCEYIQAMIHITDYEAQCGRIMSQWINNETILLDSVIIFLKHIAQTQNINWFFRSINQLPDILLKIAESSINNEICLCAYGILTEILTDEDLKKLKFPDNIRVYFFEMLEKAWQNPSKRYKQIPIYYFLRGFSNLSKNDYIQRRTAELNKILLFIDMCDKYPIVYDIIWALSFNQDIQQQLRSNSAFMSKLTHLAKESKNDQMKKNIHGILWNLELNREICSTIVIKDEEIFDIMISYSHEEKVLCKQIYDELINCGYRIWIDFNQMHGNVMDAMAQAIERSHTIIICMSEQYRKSNYCRAEAQYAFRQQRKIVPVILQKHYKPDGWLSFLIGSLLYIDFNKYEFPEAMAKLFNELKVEDMSEINVVPVRPKEDIAAIPPSLSVSSPKRSVSPIYSQNILEWTQTQVHNWLLEHNLVQMSRILTNCDGRSLIYLNKYIKYCPIQQILNLFQEESHRRINESISLIELSCFQSLMDQQKRLIQSIDVNTEQNGSLISCSIHNETRATRM